MSTYKCSEVEFYFFLFFFLQKEKESEFDKLNLDQEEKFLSYATGIMSITPFPFLENILEPLFG